MRVPEPGQVIVAVARVKGHHKTMNLQTRVCELLGIEHPIFAAGMGGVSHADLVAAVSNAGGMGVLGATFMTPEGIRREISAVREQTDRPFGVNLLIPGDIPASEAAHRTPQFPDFLQDLLAEVEGLSYELPPPLTLELVRSQLEAALMGGAAAIAAGLGTPEWLVDRAHRAGAKVMSLAGSTRHAQRLANSGADIIIAQGAEAGGHVGQVGTFVLVPSVVDAVSMPVLAAGGIADGRGLAAALMLGADGVWLGTRFLASVESVAHDNHKEKILAAEERDMVVSRSYTGKPSRVLRNVFTERWKNREADVLPMPWQRSWMAPLVAPAKEAGRAELANFPTGQVAGRIRSIAPAAEIVREMVAEARDVLAQGLPMRPPS